MKKQILAGRQWLSGKVFSRIALVVALLVPMALLFWSITYRLPLVDQAALQIKEMHGLEGDLTMAKSEWSEENAIEFRELWDSERSRLLSSYESLSAWLESINRRSRSIGIGMRYAVGELKAADEDIPGVSIIPVEMIFSFLPKKGRNNTDGYLIFMGLLKDIMEQELVLDLMKAKISGDGSKAREMKISVDTWVNFGNGAPTTLLTSSINALSLENNKFMILLRSMESA